MSRNIDFGLEGDAPSEPAGRPETVLVDKRIVQGPDRLQRLRGIAALQVNHSRPTSSPPHQPRLTRFAWFESAKRRRFAYSRLRLPLEKGLRFKGSFDGSLEGGSSPGPLET